MNSMGFAFNLGQLWQVAGSQLILIISGLGLMFLDLLFTDNENGKAAGKIGWLTVFIFLAALGHIVGKQWDIQDIMLMGAFSADKFSLFVSSVVLVAGILAAMMSMGYLEHNKVYRGEYYVLLVFAVYGTIALIQSTDLLMMFIALEVMSIAVYVLAAYLKHDEKSVEGALKYFLLGSFGSAFFIFGMALLYGLTGSVVLPEIAKTLSTGLYQDPAVLIALSMLMAGMFFKMAIVPFHMWTPDVYEGSPSIITGFMATAVKAGAFAIFIKVLFIVFSPLLVGSERIGLASLSNLSSLPAFWQPVLWWAALLSMFFGNLIAVSQTNIKRMLAYSSIAHAGYMTLGLIAASDEGRMGVLFYLACYTLMNLGAFGVVYIIDGRERNAQTLDDYAGLGFKYPGLAFLMSLFLVAMAGLPPTAGFTSKFYVLSAAVKEGYFTLAALGMLTSVMGLYYYLRVIWYMYFRDSVREVAPVQMPLSTTIALIASALCVLYFGMLPEGLSNIAMAAQQSLISIF